MAEIDDGNLADLAGHDHQLVGAEFGGLRDSCGIASRLQASTSNILTISIDSNKEPPCVRVSKPNWSKS
ncbi:MAG: hypothetical protein OXI66_16130 [Boseongicola sp.]|nr:hypothetical protein [Boseongicola sp.]